MSPANIPIWQFKLLIPAAGILLFIQGLAQVCRCIICLRTGSWPEKIEDVEETESMLLHGAEGHEELKRELHSDDEDKT